MDGPGIQVSGSKQAPEWDAAGLLRLMWECWNDVFAKTLGRAGMVRLDFMS